MSILINQLTIEKYFNKYKCSFDIGTHINIIQRIKIIEENILHKINIKGKIPQYKIYEQIGNGNIKIFADNIDNISNEKSLNNKNNIQENNLSNLEEIKPLEIISDTSIKKKKKVYNNDLMEEVQQVHESKEVKEVKLKKKKISKQLNNNKKEDINKEIVEE